MRQWKLLTALSKSKRGTFLQKLWCATKKGLLYNLVLSTELVI